MVNFFIGRVSIKRIRFMLNREILIRFLMFRIKCIYRNWRLMQDTACNYHHRTILYILYVGTGGSK